MDAFKLTKIGFIPNNWGIIKAKDYCITVTDGTHDTPEQQSEGHFLVTSKNLTDAGLDFYDCYYISKTDFNQINARSKVDRFDVLFGMIGTVGNCTIVTQERIDFAIKNVGLFKLNGDFEKALWLKNYLTSDIFINYLKRQQAGTTQQFVGLGFLRKAPIIVPLKNSKEIDIETIKSINSVLLKVDEAIEATQNSIKAAEKLKKALMQNLLTGKLKPDGTWRTEDEFYIDEKFGKYPKDWNFSRFKDYSILQRGKDLTDNEVVIGTFPVVKSNGIQIYHNQYFVKPPGVVTGRSGTIGKVFYIEEKFWSHNTTLYVKDFKGNCPKFIYYLIQRMDFRKYYAGTTVPTLNRNDIHRLKIAIPKTYQEQKSIADKLDECDNVIESKHLKINILQRLKKSLMQNLLTGKKRLDVEKVMSIINKE